MADLKKLTKIKDQVTDLKRSADRAQGAFDRILKQLKDDYDCDSLEEAKDKLSKRRKELKVVEHDFDVAMRKFEKRWGDILQ